MLAERASMQPRESAAALKASEGVQNAKRSLEDAERAAAKASRGIATAQA